MSVSEQRAEALVGANAARSSAAEFRRAVGITPVRRAQWEAARILLEETDRVAIMKVHRFLEAVPKFGEVKTRKVLTRLQVWPLRRVGELTDRQRQVLASELRRGGLR